jgi:hypothetical protein
MAAEAAMAVVVVAVAAMAVAPMVAMVMVALPAVAVAAMAVAPMVAMVMVALPAAAVANVEEEAARVGGALEMPELVLAMAAMAVLTTIPLLRRRLTCHPLRSQQKSAVYFQAFQLKSADSLKQSSSRLSSLLLPPGTAHRRCGAHDPSRMEQARDAAHVLQPPGHRHSRRRRRRRRGVAEPALGRAVAAS